MLTRKDFELLAGALSETQPLEPSRFADAYTTRDYLAQLAQFEWTVQVFANVLRSTNPGFDVAKFKAACGAT